MRLELQKLCAGYGGGSVLREISAGFETGQLSVIVGRNGAGKSTLLRAMSGMLPAGGTATLAGAPIHALPGTQRAMGLGYLPQRLRTPDMTVQTLVSHGRFSRLGFSKTLGGEDKEKIRQALEQTGMTELRFRTLPTLSGGELQRAYCAMVIAQDPDFLLLDEPQGCGPLVPRSAPGLQHRGPRPRAPRRNPGPRRCAGSSRPAGKNHIRRGGRPAQADRRSGRVLHLYSGKTK